MEHRIANVSLLYAIADLIDGPRSGVRCFRSRRPALRRRQNHRLIHRRTPTNWNSELEPATTTVTRRTDRPNGLILEADQVGRSGNIFESCVSCCIAVAPVYPISGVTGVL